MSEKLNDLQYLRREPLVSYAYFFYLNMFVNIDYAYSDAPCVSFMILILIIC